MGFSLFGRKQKPDNNTNVQENTGAVSEAVNDSYSDVLLLDNIRVDLKSVSKDEAIEMAGQVLAESGFVLPEYIEAMKEREKVLSTYLGGGIAIPHGVGAAKDKILRTGICILQFPEGVVFGEDKIAHLVVGIAGKGKEHLTILSNLAEFIQEGEAIKNMFTEKDKGKIYTAFTEKL
ncbi:MAG: mannitol transporter subunit [Eubacterium sp.]|jgi:mannitol/fructose-specific phosphotransferase system IIA component|nr:mannitol transporter subunit [Eubacterium sp.]